MVFELFNLTKKVFKKTRDQIGVHVKTMLNEYIVELL